MDKLDDSQRKLINFYQTKVDRYQTDPELCAALESEQYVILAELQTIYNILTVKTISAVPSLYQSDCVGVKNAMEPFTKIYTGMAPEKLAEIYITKYRQANLVQLSEAIDHAGFQ